MLRNMVAEMGRNQITEKDISELFNRDYRWARKRINEEMLASGKRAQFGTLDLIKIKRTFFQNCSLEYLAESDHDPEKSA